MKKVTAEEFEAMKSIDNLECFTVEQVNSYLLTVNSEISKSMDEELKERRVKEVQSLHPIEVHDWHEQTASIVKSIFYVRESQLQSAEEEDQIHKSYADTELNRELNRVGKHVYSEEIEKGGHKYFKREGTPGNYKYYYTEAQYKEAKGGDEKKEGGTFKVGDVVYNKKHNTVGIVRLEEEKGEVKTDADGNVPVTDLTKYDPKKHKGANIAPSTQKEISDKSTPERKGGR